MTCVLPLYPHFCSPLLGGPSSPTPPGSLSCLTPQSCRPTKPFYSVRPLVVSQSTRVSCVEGEVRGRNFPGVDREGSASRSPRVRSLCTRGSRVRGSWVLRPRTGHRVRTDVKDAVGAEGLLGEQTDGKCRLRGGVGDLQSNPGPSHRKGRVPGVWYGSRRLNTTRAEVVIDVLLTYTLTYLPRTSTDTPSIKDSSGVACVLR